MMLRRIIRKFGYDVVRYPYFHFSPPKQEINITNVYKQNRFKLIQRNDIDLVLDVGANEGQFGLQLRNHGYIKQIVSFEPLTDAFSKLTLTAERDPLWRVNNFALGDENFITEINIAGNSESSSILEMGKIHQDSAPYSHFIGREKIEVKKLDDIFLNFQGYKNIYLKLDVQGYEKQVFEGLKTNLHKIKGIQIEMSLVELYHGEATFFEQSQFLLNAGFKLMSLEPGFFDEQSGQLLQVDGIWFR